MSSIYFEKERGKYRAAFITPAGKRVTKRFKTKEEAEDNDFEEYTSESLQEQMEKDISENANSQVFEEPNEQNKEANKDALPPFMSA